MILRTTILKLIDQDSNFLLPGLVKRGLEILVSLLALNACSLAPVAERGREFPLLLFFTTQLVSRLSGNPDVLLAVSPSGGNAGALYAIENGQATPEPSGFLNAEIVDSIIRSHSYLALRLTTNINHFGRTCRTILVNRSSLTTSCLEQIPSCPDGKSACPGKPLQSNQSGNLISGIDANRNVFSVRPDSDPGSVRQLATGATSFVMNEAGYTLIRLTDGSFQIHHPDGGSVLAFQDPTAGCMFGGTGDAFYVQVGADIRKLSFATPTPATVWTGAPDYACGSLAEGQGLVSIIYDPAVTNNSRLYFTLAGENGQTRLLSFVDPGTKIEMNGATGTLAFAGPGSPSFTKPLGRMVGMGAQDQLLSADDLHSFDVTNSGVVYYAASWPLNGTLVGFFPAGSTTETVVYSNGTARVPAMATLK